MRERSLGFTLIEIMVVMTILAVMIGLASMAVGDGGRSERFELEARRLSVVLDQLSQEAVLKYQQLGVVFETNSYTFVMLDEESQEWAEFASSEKAFAAHEFEEEIGLELEVDGIATGILSESSIEELDIIDDDELNKVDTGSEEEKKLEPQIYLLSSGEMSDFELTIRQDGSDDYYVITGKMNGRIEFKTGYEIEQENEE